MKPPIFRDPVAFWENYMVNGYEGIHQLESERVYFENGIKIIVCPPRYAHGVTPQRSVKAKD